MSAPVPILELPRCTPGVYVVEWTGPKAGSAILGGVISGTPGAHLEGFEVAGKPQPFRVQRMVGGTWFALVPTIILQTGHPVRWVVRMARHGSLELEPLAVMISAGEAAGLEVLAVQRPRA
jgi:hypothetical protein